MDDIAKLLKNKDLAEPPEIAKIKQFVMNRYSSNVAVLIRPKDIVLSVNDASLANSLRLCLSELKRECEISKKVLIRIGS